MTNIEKAQEARKEKVLQTKIRFDGQKILTWQEFIAESINNKAIAKVYEVNKIKDMTRTQFNRATGREQDEHERRQREAGTKKEYSIGGYDVPKIVYDEFEMERLFSFEYAGVKP